MIDHAPESPPSTSSWGPGWFKELFVQTCLPEMAEVRDAAKSEAHTWPTSQASELTRDHISLGLGGLLNSLISASVHPLSLFIMLSLPTLRISHYPWAQNSLWPIENYTGWWLFLQALAIVQVWDLLSSVSPFLSCVYPFISDIFPVEENTTQPLSIWPAYLGV